MKRKTNPGRSPIVLTGPRSRKRRAPAPRDEILGKDALETPLPGRLLVLLSRLHRSKPLPDPDATPHA